MCFIKIFSKGCAEYFPQPKTLKISHVNVSNNCAKDLHPQLNKTDR